MPFPPSPGGQASGWVAPSSHPCQLLCQPPHQQAGGSSLWLLCASASSGEPGSEVAWLWTAPLPWKLHPPSLPSPSSQSHPGEQRNRGDRGGRENCGLGLPSPSFPAQPSLLTTSHTENASCPSLSPGPWRGSLIPEPSPVLPKPPGRPWPSLLEGGMELIKISLTAQPKSF